MGRNVQAFTGEIPVAVAEKPHLARSPQIAVSVVGDVLVGLRDGPVLGWRSPAGHRRLGHGSYNVRVQELMQVEISLHFGANEIGRAHV